MPLFFALARRSFQRHFSYRTAAIAGFFTNLFFGILRAALLTALYGAQTQVAGLSLEGAVTFTGLTQALIGIHSLFGWYEVMQSVYTGAVATDLLKPLGYFRFWLAQDAGRALAQWLLRGVTMMLVYALLYPVVWPKHVGQWLGLALALVMAWMLCFCWRFLINLAAFWSPSALGPIRFGFILLYFFTGFIMPLRLFPDAFVQAIRWTPFPSMINTVVEIYLNLLEGPALLGARAAQAAWILALGVLCQLVLKAGLRRLVIHGG
jgi:ABC-2 type transport system permease protein